MPVMETTIEVFPPKQRKSAASISSIVPQQTVDALGERLGSEAKDRAAKSLRMMKRDGIDLIQFRLPDGHRIRIKQG